MKTRQETPYAARVAKLSDKKLSEEIGRLMIATMSDDAEAHEQLSVCGIEDDRRGKGCWDKALTQFNAAIGLRQTGANQFHYDPLQQETCA